MQSRTVFQAMIFMALYGLVQSIVWGLVRYLGEDLSTATLFFYRNLIGFLTILPILTQNGFNLFLTKRFPLHALRALVALTGGFAAFYAVSHAPLASVTAITYAAPIVASLIAMTMLGEGINFHRLIALPIGFLGVLFVLRPSFEISTAGMIGATIATITTAVAFLAVKRLSSTEKPETIVAYPFLLILPISAILAAQDWTSPTIEQMPLVILMGLGISLSQYFMVKAFANADASAVLPVDFIRIIAAAMIGIGYFGDILEIEVLIGAAIILSATVYSAHFENVKIRKLDHRVATKNKATNC